MRGWRRGCEGGGGEEGEEISTWPNLPIAPCSLRPVNVVAICQKRMWPVPEVMSSPSVRGEKETRKISCEKAFVRSVIFSCRQFHTVSM